MKKVLLIVLMLFLTVQLKAQFADRITDLPTNELKKLC